MTAKAEGFPGKKSQLHEISAFPFPLIPFPLSMPSFSFHFISLSIPFT